MTAPTHRYTLIFDGDCGFCTTFSRLIERRSANTQSAIQAVPWQWADLPSLGLTEAQAADRVWIVEQLGEGSGEQRIRAYGGHECVAKLAELHGTVASKLISRLMISRLLSPISAIGYRLVARYRHLLPGGTPACKLPRE